MPTIAILADVHGNVPALEAVLADLDSVAPDEVLVGGDLVGRGPEGSRVTRTISERGWRTIRGNHEEYLLAFRRGDIPPEWHDAEMWAASRWMAAELGEDDVAYLDGLPEALSSELAPDVRLVHGTPRSANEGIGPWTADAAVERHLGSIDQTVLVCAHTHRPLDRQLACGQVINVGSVGLPFNRDPRAQYVLLRPAGDRVDVEFRRVPYDRDETRRIYRRSGFLEAGGATARLLLKELDEAAPFLVPFLSWAEAEERPPLDDSVDAFLAVYDPDRQREFFNALTGRPASTVGSD